MKIVVIGLTLSSSWGNGHATTYRSLLKALAKRGHDCLFLECERPWYRKNQDLVSPDFCSLRFYHDLHGLRRFEQEISSADLIVVGSFTCEGIAVGDYVLQQARGVRAFYDIDTPVTLSAVTRDACAYLTQAQMASYDLYLSFSGGTELARLTQRFGVKRPRPLYCSSELPLMASRARYDLTYMGTYSDDRQSAIEEMLMKIARAFPDRLFLVAGPQYPDSISWPRNVQRRDHISPQDHAAFYADSRFTLNVTRHDMKQFGFSPSVRLFEAAAAGTPIISDRWTGIETIFEPQREICLASSCDEVMGYLAMAEPERQALIHAARHRFEKDHSADQRAKDLEAYVAEVSAAVQPEGASCCCP